MWHNTEFQRWSQFSYSIHEAWRFVTKLCYFFLREAPILRVSFAFTPALVFSSQNPPHQAIDCTRHSYQTEGDCMASNITRPFAGRVYCELGGKQSPLQDIKQHHLRNGAITPLEFPMVNCKPVAVVLFPYRGLFAGNQARGMPTTTYKPRAIRKQPKYLTPLLEFDMRMPYPTTEITPKMTLYRPLFCCKSDKRAATR